MIPRLKIGHLVLIFALAALPFAATFALYYPDERHYTDGALVMLKDHDWLVPKTADSLPRFQKPPLAYWAIAASYQFFGVNVIASRLPFLLASCGTLFLTFQLARKLTASSETALLAALVLLSQPQFFLCSIRSMPDALLVFFTTLSLCGFLRLIVFEERTAGAFWMAYLGAALAILSKGLLGAGIILFACSFVFWQEQRRRAVAKLIHLPTCIIALILGIGWFAYIFWRAGAPAWRHFFGDQVTGNMHGHFWSPLWRMPLFALVLVFNFLPWSATAIEFLVRQKISLPDIIPPVAKKFILAWTIFLIFSFALGSNISLRYLLPAAPLMAILIAGCLQEAARVKLFFSIQRMLKIILAIFILAEAAAFWIDSQWKIPAAALGLIGGLFLFGVIALGTRALRRESIPATEALGLMILLLWLLFFAAATPILLPENAQQVAATVVRAGGNPAKPMLFIGDLQMTSRLRVLLGKNWTIVQRDRLNLADAGNFNIMLLPAKDAYLFFINHDYKILAASAGPGAPPATELWAALKSRRLPQELILHGEKYCLVTRE